MLTTEQDAAIDTTLPTDTNQLATTSDLATHDKETSPDILDNGIASGHGTEPYEPNQSDSLQHLIEQQHADLADHLIAWQQANPDQGHDIEALYRIGNQYKAYRILAGDWVFARQEAGNAPGAEAGQGTAQSLSAGAVSSVPDKSMGSDSIDPERFRFPIPSSGRRLHPPLHLLLDALFEPVASQHPCLVRRFPDFSQTGLRDMMPE